MSIWQQSRFRGPKRHALGLWLPTAKLASRAYVPAIQDRKSLMGKRPFWFVFGGATGGDVAITANQWVELRHVCQTDFTAHTLMISVSVTASTGGVRCQIRDLSPRPGGKTKFLSLQPVNDNNFGGSAQHPFFFRKPHTFRQGHTIVVRIQNLQSSTNNVQVVLAGVQDE